nr:protein tonB2-like [Aegilops tauschii subsp. strangulata]
MPVASSTPTRYLATRQTAPPPLGTPPPSPDRLLAKRLPVLDLLPNDAPTPTSFAVAATSPRRRVPPASGLPFNVGEQPLVVLLSPRSSHCIPRLTPPWPRPGCARAAPATPDARARASPPSPARSPRPITPPSSSHARAMRP